MRISTVGPKEYAEIRSGIIEVGELVKGATKDLREALQTSVPLSPYVESRIRAAIQKLEKIAK